MSISDVDVLKSQAYSIELESDIVIVRQIVRKWAVENGFNLIDQTKIITAASELARNTVIHGKGGQVTIELLQKGGRKGLRLIFEDRGPGIEDINLALQDHFSTGVGLGLGLGGAKRLSNEFSIQSQVNQGTTVSIIRWNSLL